MKYRKLLSVDPAVCSGLALFDIKTRRLESAITLNLKDVISKKLTSRDARMIYISETYEIIKQIDPCIVVVEGGYIGANHAGSMLMEGRRWVWEQSAIMAGKTFGERVHPATWQAQIGIPRGSDRKQVKAYAVHHVLMKYGKQLDMPHNQREKYLKKNQDLCDAICIGEVATWQYSLSAKVVQ